MYKFFYHVLFNHYENGAFVESKSISIRSTSELDNEGIKYFIRNYYDIPRATITILKLDIIDEAYFNFLADNPRDPVTTYPEPEG